MKITYHKEDDVLYFKFNKGTELVTNIEVNDWLIVDINEENKLVGIEILNPSIHISLENLEHLITQ